MMKKYFLINGKFNEELVKDIIHVKGVAGIIKSTQNNIFLVLENEKKPWKKPGQWSVPMETIEKGETLEQALKRGLKEELGIEINNNNKIFCSNFPINFYVYDSKKEKLFTVELGVYDVFLTKEQENIAKNFTNGEIRKVKLFSLTDILQGKVKPLRPGTKEAILALNGKLEKKIFYIKDGDYFNG